MIRQRIILHDFRSLTMKNRLDQSSSLEWLIAAHTEAEHRASEELSFEEKASLIRRIRKLVPKVGGTASRVRFRNSALDDFTHKNWEKMRIFNLKVNSKGSGFTERSLFFSEVVQDVLNRFYEEEKDPPSTMMHVTCTGYVAPSGVQRLVARKNWGRQTEVLHAYHMGCYAALPSIRIAMGPLSCRRGRVDIIHTELCSLHLDPTQHLLEQLVIQTLFSDGVIRYSVSHADSGVRGASLRVVGLREEILPQTESEMTWMAADHGMQMSLSREVPERIAESLVPFLERLAGDSGLSLSALQEQALFAVHPGGPKIIDGVQKLLGLSDTQVEASNQILEEFGNMSSATLPHILKDILENSKVDADRWIVALAFGPGLTFSGAILQKILQS